MEGEFWQGRGIRPRAFTLAKEEILSVLSSVVISGRATVGCEG
jgi:hypothetical protein